MELHGTADSYSSEANQEPLKNSGVPSPPTSASGCFDCNICLDFAVDPVVTLCGHLYCWPCIYKWLQVDSVPAQQCPVCKASISENALVPLYGRGHSGKRSQQSADIPRRPSSTRHQDQTLPEPEPDSSDIHAAARRRGHQHFHLHQHEHHHHYPYHGHSLGDYIPLTQPSRMTHSMAGGALGGMAVAVLPRVFRNHQEAAGVHYTNPFSVEANGGSPRLRRQEIEVEISLHQIWLFLVLCAVLCLLLF